jgi:hypothetical protein
MMTTKGRKVKSMTCPKAPDIAITQEVLDKDSLPWASVGFTQRLLEVRIINGKHVALVGDSDNATKEAGGHDEPYLKCACDFHCVNEGNSIRMLVDTFKCERNRAWATARRKQVGDEYRARGVSLRDTILELCDRVWNKGEYVGQTQGSWLFVQHVAEMLSVTVGTVLNEIGELYGEKRLSLNGMVLIPYIEPPADVVNTARTPMVTWGNINLSAVDGLVWAAKFDGRFQIEVQRKHNEYKGVLCIFDHDVYDVLLHAVDVDLLHGARFGPDVDDVTSWRLLVTEFVDKNFPKKIV